MVQMGLRVRLAVAFITLKQHYRLAYKYKYYGTVQMCKCARTYRRNGTVSIYSREYGYSASPTFGDRLAASLRTGKMLQRHISGCSAASRRSNL
jgi:hypothetical protein